MTPRQQDLLEIIDTLGITSPVILQAFTGLGRVNLQQTLEPLYDIGDIIRPVRGLILSRRYIAQNPDIARTIGDNLEIDLRVYLSGHKD